MKTDIFPDSTMLLALPSMIKAFLWTECMLHGTELQM